MNSVCKHGTTKSVKLNTPRPVSGSQFVYVDACIADEVQKMNDLGIITIGSCCGHDEEDAFPHVLIDEKSAVDAYRFGYVAVPYYHGNNDYRGVYIVELKREKG